MSSDGLTNVREVVFALWASGNTLRLINPDGLLWDAMYVGIAVLFFVAVCVWCAASVRAFGRARPQKRAHPSRSCCS